MTGCKSLLLGLWLFLITNTVFAQVTFVVNALPGTTPEDDTIFVSGTFNNWAVDSIPFMLNKQINGALAITLNLKPGIYEYKFTRGSWMKVETSERNEYMPNRKAVVDDPQKRLRLNHQIDNWQDLGGARKLYYMLFLMFAMAFQILIWLILLSRSTKLEPYLFRWHVLFNTFLILFFLATVWYHLTNQVIQAYLSMIAVVISFLIPLIALSWLSVLNYSKIPFRWFYFLPFYAVCFIQVIRLLHFDFWAYITPGSFDSNNTGQYIMLGLSAIWALLLGGQHKNRLSSKSNSLQERPKATNYLTRSLLILYFLTSFLFLINSILLIMGISPPFLQHYDAIKLLLAVIAFVEVYYLWRYPEILQHKQVTHHISEDEWDALKEKLQQLMKVQKPFTDPDLNITTLSEMLETKPHILSKLINEAYQKNFRDYVNAYRVEEFIRLAQMPKYKPYTFLAIAHEVGFNSKSTFNLAFKKVTDQSPSAYLRSLSL